ncbi:MAG: calcium/sodium antiporter [Candidatus Woesearchaeota archaeon]
MIEYVLFILGIILLLKSADYLIEGSSSLAQKMGVSTLVIGLTVVAFGTSLPELLITIIAALQGSGDIAFGNIIGSSMSNTLLILGIMALITSLQVKSSTTWKEIPFSFFAVFLLFIFALSSLLNTSEETLLSRMDGILLLVFFSIFVYYVYTIAQKDKRLIKETQNEKPQKHSNVTSISMILGGLIGLFFGGKWTVDGAVIIAQNFGLSEFFISATIVAIGTSLPELITAIVAAIKKNIDLAVGNIIGSNIFNILWVLGLTAVITPIRFPYFVLLDLLMLLGATFLLFIFMFTGGKHKLDRWEGIIFLCCYVSYIVFLVMRG